MQPQMGSCVPAGALQGSQSKLIMLGMSCRLSWSLELEALYEALRAPVAEQQAAQEALQAAEAASRRETATAIKLTHSSPLSICCVCGPSPHHHFTSRPTLMLHDEPAYL